MRAASAIASIAACLSAAAALVACESREVPACVAGMPQASTLLQNPAFATLTYHQHTEFDIRRGVGYDLWGDRRFEYRAGLEFESVPVKGGRNDNDLCVQAISLRFVSPGRDREREAMVAALVHAVAAQAPLDAAAVVAEIDGLMASEAKYHLLTRNGRVSVYAGRITHPVRGEVFVATLSWAGS